MRQKLPIPVLDSSLATIVSTITEVGRHMRLETCLFLNLFFVHHAQGVANKSFNILAMMRPRFQKHRVTDFNFIYGAYLRTFVLFVGAITYSGLQKDYYLLTLVQWNVTKLVVGLKYLPNEIRLNQINLFHHCKNYLVIG